MLHAVGNDREITKKHQPRLAYVAKGDWKKWSQWTKKVCFCYQRWLEETEAKLTQKADIKKATFQAAGEVHKAINDLTPGFQRRTSGISWFSVDRTLPSAWNGEPLISLDSRQIGPHFCVRSSTPRGLTRELTHVSTRLITSLTITHLRPKRSDDVKQTCGHTSPSFSTPNH